MVSSTVVVFDFDKTIINVDSDNWVVDNLGATELFEQLLPTMPWNSLVVEIWSTNRNNDYCLTLKLSERDFAMPRKNYRVWDFITSNINLIKAEIHKWSNGEELEMILLEIINRITKAQDAAKLKLPVDCKFQTAPPMASNEALPKALRVTQ